MRGTWLPALCAAGGCYADADAAVVVAGWVSVVEQAAFNSSKPTAKTLPRLFQDLDMTLTSFC